MLQEAEEKQFENSGGTTKLTLTVMRLSLIVVATLIRNMI